MYRCQLIVKLLNWKHAPCQMIYKSNLTTDEDKQDGGPQTACTNEICKKFDNVATRDLERAIFDDKSL